MIKKQSIAALLLLVCFQSFAQLNKGKVMINGRGNFYTVKSEGVEYVGIYSQTVNQKNSNGNLNLNIGYFFTNNFAVGVSTGYGIDKNKRTNFQIPNNYIVDEKDETTFAGFFLRYNRQIRNGKFGFFFQLDNTYNWQKGKTTASTGVPTDPSLRKGKGSRIGLTPGVLYFIGSKVSIEASLGDVSYESFDIKSQTNPNYTTHQSTSRFNSNFSFSTFYLGLTLYLGGQKTEEKKATE